MRTLQFATTYEVTCCSECGIQYGLPLWFRQSRVYDGQRFFCPSGHGQSYGDGTVKVLERRLAQEQQAHDQTKARAREAEEAAEVERQKAKRLRTRAANGVCPCCKRTFKELARHMTTKHPDYAPAK